MVQLFEGTCYLTPLLGAWLADSRWGRYRTIMVFSFIYMLVRSHAPWGLAPCCLTPPDYYYLPEYAEGCLLYRATSKGSQATC